MIPRFFITRPIAAGVLAFLILLVGVIAMLTRPIAQYPDVVPPQVVVTAFYPGANAQTVSETVATPIELEINGVENMLYVESQCTNDGAMRLTVTFAHGTDPDMAQVLVQNRVGVATPKLPEEVRRIGVVTKKQSSGILLVVSLTKESEAPPGEMIAERDARILRDQLEVSDVATRRWRDELARINGVGDVFMFGQRELSVRVWLDPLKMADRKLAASDVTAAIRSQNQQVAAGVIGQPPAPRGQTFQYTLSTQGRLPDAKSFEDIILKTGPTEQLVRIGDVGRVELGARNYDTSSQLDGKPSVGMPVFQLPGSSAFDTAEAVLAKVEQLKKDLPPGVKAETVFNPTTFVKASVDEVIKTLLEAFLLVFVVVYLFLQSWRAALIPMIAVPVSLVGTFVVMAGLGFSINNLTLFGLVLAIGIVVDDAIVVVEAVEAEIAKGLSPFDATVKAMKEVSGAIIGVSIVLAAVFIPSAFLPGLTGQFFRQFAVTIAASTIISLVVSLTLSPALCPLLLRPHPSHGGKRDPFDGLMHLVLGWWFFRAFNWAFGLSGRVYGWSVGWLARLFVLVVLVYVGLLVLTGGAFARLPGGFIPQQDQGYLIVNVELPPGASLQLTQETMNEVAEICLEKRDKDGHVVSGVEGVSHVTAVSGFSVLTQANLSNSGGIYLSLAPFEERVKHGRSAEKIVAELNEKLSKLKHEGQAQAFPAPPILGLGNAGGFKLQVLDQGGVGAGRLEGMTWNMVGNATKVPGIPVAFSSYRSASPQVFIEVDRERAQQAGVTVQAINDTLQTYLGSVYVNDVTLLNRNWQVNVQAEPEFRSKPSDIGALKVRASNGVDMVPLEGLIKKRDIAGPSKVNRFQLYPSADVNGITVPFLISSGAAIDQMEQIAKRDLPDDGSMGIAWTDMAYQQNLAKNQSVRIPGIEKPVPLDMTIVVFALSTLVAYLVLAFLYESLLLPLAVILVVPMCLLCAAVGVFLTRGDLNIFTQIGLVVLVGLACKNAILIVEYARQRRAEGLSRLEAAKEAAKERLRPILMTSFAFILGVVPLVVAEGAGAEMRRALGVAVFAGMIGVTVFGLVLTPVFYFMFDWSAVLFGWIWKGLGALEGAYHKVTAPLFRLVDGPPKNPHPPHTPSDNGAAKSEVPQAKRVE